jgi:Prokaryotic homologs of the JAB domain
MSFRRAQSGLIRGSSEPVGVGGSGAHSAAPVTSVSQSLEREVPELRSTPSPVEVTLSRSAGERISDDLFWSTRTDSLESGGFLFAKPTRSWVKSVEIVHATRTGNADRWHDRVSLDTDTWRNAEAAFAIDGLELELCGLWHSHPGTRDGTPSSADLAALLGVLDFHANRGRSAAWVGRLDLLGFGVPGRFVGAAILERLGRTTHR